jgi:hypothetical protein
MADKGGWVTDQQYIPQMGSPYLMAHGLGKAVADARGQVEIPRAGAYYVHVRTKDWAPFPTGPGAFQVIVGTDTLGPFGNSGLPGWQWYKAGPVELRKGSTAIALHDLTGFNGRCDAIVLSRDAEFELPKDKEELQHLRFSGKAGIQKAEKNYDLIVTGGGLAGTCAAISAARMGLEVALVQDRPVLGGNNSSEIRVNLRGKTSENRYKRLGRIVRELDNGPSGNTNTNPHMYGDQRKKMIVENEENIDLYLEYHAYAVEMERGAITAIRVIHIKDNGRLKLQGKLFADCTGDGTIGHLAGADYRLGRESKNQTGEKTAVGQPDEFVMGTSNLWYARHTGKASSFPECPWALQFGPEYHLPYPKASWRWESGYDNMHPIEEAEEIRDHNLRAIFGNWAYLKNETSAFADWELDWAAYIGGKRESRRLLGPVILSETDILEGKPYPDGVVTTTWELDQHYPDTVNSIYFPGQEFISYCVQPEIEPYEIPYRCLYSRNINNLFMAGRNISVTHVALGTVRVMRTTGMMGEAIGYAAYLCRMHSTSPDGLYLHHLDDYLQLLSE